MRGASARDYVVNVELSAKTCVEGPKPLSDIASQRLEVVDIIVEVTTNPLLIGLREFVRLCNGLVEGLSRHASSVP
jgi:hypothetical protein